MKCVHNQTTTRKKMFYIHFIIKCLIVSSFIQCVCPMSASSKKHFKMEVLEMFSHSFDAYMNNAFPADELSPLTCQPKKTWGE